MLSQHFDYLKDSELHHFGSDLNYITVAKSDGLYRLISSCEHKLDAAIFDIEDIKQLRDGLNKILESQ